MTSFLRPAKSKKEFFLGLNMLTLDIPTPQPVLYAERRVCGFLRENYLVTVGLEGAMAFSENLRALPDAKKVAAMREAALFIRQMLDRGFQHVDCEAAHVFVEGDASAVDAHKRMYYIDVDGGRLHAQPREAVLRKSAFQFFRSLPSGMLSDAMKRAFVDALYGRALDGTEYGRLLSKLEQMENWTVQRKRILKALYLKRRS